VVPPGREAVTPSTGMGYICSYLRSKGHDVEIADLDVELYWHESMLYESLNRLNLAQKTGKLLEEGREREFEEFVTESFRLSSLFFHNEMDGLYDKIQSTWVSEYTEFRRLKDLDRFITSWSSRIASGQYGIVGISTLVSSRIGALLLCRRLKEASPGTLVVVGGPDAHPVCFEKIYSYERSIDVVVKGDGEETLDMLLKNPKEAVAGCYIRRNASVHNTGEPARFDIGQNPPPDYDDFPLEGYRIPGYLTLVTSRGCPFACEFCQEKLITGKYREKRPESVVNEIRHLVDRYYPKLFIRFNDSTMNSNPRRLKEICDLIIKSGGPTVPWEANFRVTGLSEALLEKLYKAGCRRLIFGLESFSPRILKLMRKGTTPRLIKNVLETAKKIGFYVHGYWIVGYPGETREDLHKTRVFIANNVFLIDSAFFHPATVEYGTALHRRVRSEMRISCLPVHDEVDGQLRDYYMQHYYTIGHNTPQERIRRTKELMLLRSDACS